MRTGFFMLLLLACFAGCGGGEKDTRPSAPAELDTSDPNKAMQMYGPQSSGSGAHGTHNH